MKNSLVPQKTLIITEIAIMAAVICILGPLSIPLGLIPVSLTPFTVFLSVYILGQKSGTISCFIYLLIGLIGGVHRCTSPTPGTPSPHGREMPAVTQLARSEGSPQAYTHPSSEGSGVDSSHHSSTHTRPGARVSADPMSG